MIFATIFQNFEKVHLTKDVGMIPAAFGNASGCLVYLIYWDRTGKKINHDYGDNFILTPLSAKSKYGFMFRAFIFSIKNRVTILHLFHLKRETYLLAFFFKVFGKKIYLKMDMDSTRFPKLKQLLSKKSSLKSLLLRGLLRLPNVISTESKQFFNVLREFDFLNDRVIYFPNSLYTPTVSCAPLPWEDRVNRILVVGRIGDYQKNNEMLLEALKGIQSTNGWEIFLIGPITSDFSNSLLDFYRDKPLMKDSVKYVGVLDRKSLFDYYSNSKIMLVTSRWEILSLAMVESSYMGMALLTTNVDGSDILTKNGELGEIIDNDSTEKLKSALLKIFDTSYFYDDFFNERINFFRREFCLDKNINQLIKKLR